MKERIRQAIRELLAREGVGEGQAPPFTVERPREAAHGDLATNAALVSAKALRRPPRQLAEALSKGLQDIEHVRRVEIAGPGFINLFLAPAAWLQALPLVLQEGGSWGRSRSAAGERVLIEFVSANPTGPLHFGHGRGAVVGDVLANLLEWSGRRVEREYYVNDAGGQAKALALSLLFWLKKNRGLECEFPADGYRGDYVAELAQRIPPQIKSFLPGDPDRDQLEALQRFALEEMLELIRRDLDDFGIRVDNFVSEAGLARAGKLAEALGELERRGLLETRDGARWFLSDRFGDEKPRVLVKQTGENTYFATDLAYHLDKLRRGYDRLVDVWGADHHGYIARMKAALCAFGYPPEKLEVVLVQMVSLLRDGSPVVLSKRQGEIVTLRQVFEEVGRDAARFFFLLRGPDSQMEFDLELAKRKSLDNPVFYAQYGHARLCSILARAAERGIEVPRPEQADAATLAVLELPEEVELARRLGEFGEIICGAAEARAPHLLVYYLQELVSIFHGYYTKYGKTHPVLAQDPRAARARLILVLALRQVLRNAFALLGVEAPERMESAEEAPA